MATIFNMSYRKLRAVYAARKRRRGIIPASSVLDEFDSVSRITTLWHSRLNFSVILVHVFLKSNHVFAFSNERLQN